LNFAWMNQHILRWLKMSNNFKTFTFNGLINSYGSYQPKHIIAGDTDSVYIDLSCKFDKDADKDEVIAFADMIGKEANDAFPQFMKDIFNVDTERASVIQTDREAVADKAYFLGKKMYVMHLVDMEGMPVDKLKIMGVAIKKSDTPKIIQSMLTDLVNLLMDKKTYEEIKIFIDIFKKEYHAMSFLEIGNPKSVKSLKKYEIKYEDTNNMKGFPYHVRASMYYNSLCGSSDAKIMSGDKVRIVYLNHHSFKYIAVPVDVEVLPDFINNLIVDWETQWGTVQKKIDIFLTPIGYDRTSRQNSLTKSLLKY